jgi:hypothetical protein
MNSVLQSCQFVLETLKGIILRVRDGVRTNCHQPGDVSKAAAGRFLRAIRLIEAYLRRVLLTMALQLEPSLVDTSKEPGRPKEKRRTITAPLPRFVVLDDHYAPLDEDRLAALTAELGSRHTDSTPDKPVRIDSLCRRLERLAMIAQDPLTRARRLAFHLARYRPGPILAPDRNVQLPRAWGTEAGSTFDAMGYAILRDSKSRPPPLPPPKRHGPSIIVLG